MKKNSLIVGAVIALILFLDQWIKVYVKTHFLPGEEFPLVGSWFVAEYVENPGMAFGTTFGGEKWHKLALSIFRILAIIGIVYYWIKQAKSGVRLEFLVAIGFVLAGATGNLIDSMAYDFIFPYDPCMPYNRLEGSGIKTTCGVFGVWETRHTGFLLGNVVDMFKFNVSWPSWMPWLAGKQVFPAIWNLADGAITCGVLMIILRQKRYFAKKVEA